MPKVEFFLGQPKQVEFEAKRPMIVEESKVQSNYTENDPSAPSHILNRPFYSETVTEPFEIKWDGVWGGRPYTVIDHDGLDGIAFIKVSDTVFDLEQLKDSYVTIFSSYGDLPQGTIPFSSLEVTSIDFGTGFVHMVTSDGLPVFAILTNDIFFEGNSYEKGTYFGILRLIDSAEGDYTIYSIYTSALSFPSVAYEKYYKLDNNFVDAEWMATESEGVGTKKFSLVNFYDALIVGGIYASMPIVQLDSRPYTEEELKGARLTFDIKNVPLAYTVAFTETIDNVLTATMIGIEGEAYFYLLSMEEDGFLDELPLKKGLYILTDLAVDFSEVSNITLEIFNATGQTIPNKLPNKFLDLDWIPKTETMQEVLYEGAISGSSSIRLKNEPLLLDLDTVLLFQVGADIREVRGLGIPVPIGFAVYLYTLSNGEYIAVAASADNGTQLEYSVESETHVTITLLKRASNPIPSYFLPDGVGSAAVITINNRVEDGIGGHEAEILEAWNGGGRVVLQFTDVSLTLLSFSLNLDGVEAIGVNAAGQFYLFNPLSRGNGWALELDADRDVPYILYKRAGQTEFAPAFLHSTLTEGSTLPAQEGAVFTAIQNLENTIGTLNQDLENRLNGGT